MAKEKVTRRLAAIFAADMVGFSRLMEADEEGTIARQKAHRKELIDPKISEHDGRIVKTTGDGLLVEFASVVDAVRCAVEVQQAMAEREADASDDRRIQYRIGINLGDIVIEGDDVMGDGVNVAARLEALAKPGEVLISGTAFDQLKKKLEYGYRFQGERKVKNIAEPVRMYGVLPDTDAGKVLGRQRLSPKAWRWAAGAAAAVLLLVAAGLAWWQPWAPAIARVSPADMDHPLPKKPSIAVLLFENVSGDAKQGHIAKGLTAYVIATLSKASGMFVIAQESIFAIAGKPASEQEVARKLGVRYVLKGTVGRTGKRIRVTARLADVVDGRILWSETYDRELDDLLAVQEAITKEIFAAMQVTLTRGEQARVWKLSCPKLEAYLLYMQALESMWRFNPADNARARTLAERAIRLDDKCVVAVILASWIHRFDAVGRWTKTPAKSWRLVRHYAEEAKRIDADNPDIHPIFCGLELAARRHDRALAHCRKAVDLTPGHSLNHAIYAWALSFSGKPREAIRIMRKAMRLSPRYPHWYLGTLARSQNLVGEREAALKTARAASRRKDNRSMRAHAILARVLIELGRTDEAKAVVAEVLKRRPNFSARVLARSFPYKDPKDLKRLLAALRKAGLPE